MRHSWQFKGDRCDRAFLIGGAVVLLHLKSPRHLRKSAATRVARQGVPAHVCNYEETAKIGNGPNTVSGSTVSNTELSEFFLAH